MDYQIMRKYLVTGDWILEPVYFYLISEHETCILTNIWWNKAKGLMVIWSQNTRKQKQDHDWSAHNSVNPNLFPKTLPLKWICCCTEYLMSRLKCKKVLFCSYFLIEHVLDICKNHLAEAILTNIRTICFFKVLNTIFLHNLWLTVTS